MDNLRTGMKSYNLTNKSIKYTIALQANAEDRTNKKHEHGSNNLKALKKLPAIHNDNK